VALSLVNKLKNADYLDALALISC